MTTQYTPHVRYSSHLCFLSVYIIYKLYMNYISRIVENTMPVCILAGKRSKQMKERVK